MPFRKFLLWDFVCATLVVGTFFSLSYFYGQQITALVRNAELTFTLVICLLGILVGVWWMRYRRHKMLDEAIDLHAEEGPLASPGKDAPNDKKLKSSANSKANEEVA